MLRAFIAINTILLLNCSILLGQTITWQTEVDSVNNFSSPHLVDLTGDGVLDIVVGGGLEDNARLYAASAFNGANGDILWHTAARDQIFGSAIFMDITGDGIPESFLGGRDAIFMAIDGRGGQVVWEFYPQGATQNPADDDLYNFYNAQFIPDQDNDGLEDILVGNGGDKFAGPLDFERPAGHVMVISAKDGKQIAKAVVPDGQEIYMSILVADLDKDGTLEVIFGTGGETTTGSLWRTTLADVLAEDISGAIELVNGDRKGIVAPPSLADFNSDGVLDIIAHMYNGHIVAINGANNRILWEHNVEMGEAIASPVIGFFNDDLIPDVFSAYGIGIAPTFLEFKLFMFDGATGTIEYEESKEGFTLITPIAYDHDEDGMDEVLIPTHKPFKEGPPFQHKLTLIDFNDGQESDIVSLTDGAILGPTPWVGDMDDDGDLELVYVHHTAGNSPKPSSGFSTKRIELTTSKPDNIAFGAYMGTHYDGKYYNELYDCPEDFRPEFDYDGRLCTGFGHVGARMLDGQAPFTITWNDSTFPPLQSREFEISGLEMGDYTLSITDANGCLAALKVGFPNPVAPLVATIEIVDEELAPENGASIGITATGGTGTLTYEWSNGSTEATINNLTYGTYTVTITDENACSIEQTAIIAISGIEDEILHPLQVYPNPTIDGEIWINLPPENGNLSIYNSKGQLIVSQNLIGNNTNQALPIQLTNQGIYWIFWKNDDTTYSTPIVVLE